MRKGPTSGDVAPRILPHRGRLDLHKGVRIAAVSNAMPEITDENVTKMPVSQRERSATYLDAHFRTPDLARFLAWIRQGPGATITWGGERWERVLTLRRQLAMAVCRDLGLKVIQQNPNTGTIWARLAREGHDVWQVLTANGRYLGVIVDGVYRSYDEIDRTGNEQGRRRGARGSRAPTQDGYEGGDTRTEKLGEQSH
jgi:hypothetical protein